MELTIEWMEVNFLMLNRKYFGGKLPSPKFYVVRTDKYNGRCGVKGIRTKHPSYYIKLNCQRERTQYEYRCTLLHEMIHLYWYAKGERHVGHGDRFVRIVRYFRLLGWKIKLK